MKKITILAASVAALAMTLAGCVHDNKFSLKCPVHFTSTIEGRQTRVSGDRGNVWDASDEIGIYMYADGQGVGHVEANHNLLHTHTGNGVFDGADLYYPGDGGYVNFVAYYPYHADLHNVDGHVYRIDVTDQTQNIDLMYAPVVRKNADPVNLQFSHQLSRLIFFVSDITGADLTNIVTGIVGMPATGTFDLTADSPAVTVDAESTAAFNAEYIGINEGVARVEAIVMPGQVDYSLFVTLADGSTAPVPVGVKTYVKGMQYTYNVSLNMIQKKVEVIEGNITGWGDGNSEAENLTGIKTPPAAVPNPAIDESTFISDFDGVAEIPAAADDFSIMFDVLNPAENAVLSFEGTSEWVVVTEVPAQAGRTRAAGPKTVELNAAVAANTGEARQGTIVVKYNGATLKNIGFTQAAGTPAETSWVEVLNEPFTGIAGGNTDNSGSSSSWNGNANFPTVDRAYQAGDAIKIGASGNPGSITSKALDLSGGPVKVSLKVKGWTTVEGNIIITIGEQLQTITYTETMTAGFGTYSADFNAETAASTVKIATSAKRAFIDDVVIEVQR